MQDLTIVELQRKMTSGATSAASLTSYYLDRIQALDKQGPTVNAVLTLNPDAMSIAQSLDAERAEAGPRGPLHGIPVLIKDNIDTADKMPTTAGSLALAESFVQQDATVVSRLREAGAVLLGKTNLSEWANFRSIRSTSGWSSLGGQTRNPYALDRSPCGSSSGSGVAVAVDFCAAAIGTETDGSVVCPSAVNGIVGIKPTVGLVSRAGIVPVAHSQDTAGPMARCVADAAALLGALTGTDARDPATGAGQGHFYQDYSQFLDIDGLKGARIGVARNFSGFHPQVDEIVEAALEVMRRLGAEIVDPANIPTAKQLDEPEYEVLLYEFKADLNTYLASLGANAPVKTMADVIAFNLANREWVMPYFGQEHFLQAQEKGPLTDEAYLQALADCRRLARTEGIDATLAEHRLDAIIAPTTGPAWTMDLVNGDPDVNASSTPAAVAGYPSITVPAGTIHGLPVGISFFAGAWQEPMLIKLAYAFEQATQVCRPPQFLPSVGP